MKVLLALVVLFAFCHAMSSAFLFTKKFVDGCNPDPCEHKGTCKLNALNKNISTCICPQDYHGVKCELKTGCRAKPCKKGTCANDRVNPSNYICTCDKGYVGKNCDTKDGCAGKSPCVNGKCTINAKNSVECVCSQGWKGSKCDKRNCTIERFTGKNFESKPKVYIDPVAAKKFKDLDALAKICNVKIVPKRSFSKQLTNAKVLEKNDVPFYVGRALQFEVNDAKGKVLCNQICLSKPVVPVKEAKCLIDGLDAIGFKVHAPGIIYDGSLSTNLAEYNSLKDLHQVGCKDSKDF